MSALHAGADLAAIQELEALFRAADPANTGALSYSEFAYLILRSGGTQEQVDALIEQFSGPSRAQRVVYYGALLERLYDSLEAAEEAHGVVEDDGPRDASSSQPRRSSLRRTPSSASPLDTSDRSPWPIPPAPTGATPSLWHAPTRSAATASSSSPFYRSVTHAGASISGVASPCSRESSIATYASCSTRHNRPLAHLPNSRGAASLHSPLRGRSSPYSSERFVESALRAATAAAPPQQLRFDRAPSHCNTHSSLSVPRSQCRDEACADLLTPSSTERAQDAERARLNVPMAALHDATGTSRYPLASRAYHPVPPGSRPGRRESSIERMMRVAAEVTVQSRSQPRFESEGGADVRGRRESEGRRGSDSAVARREAWPCPSPPSYATPVHAATTNRASRTAASQANCTHASFAERRATESCARPADHSVPDSQQSFSSATPLLSLRDIFQRHLAPTLSHDGTVLLSELEAALATRGVDVHPLELEAVADSLELSGVPAAIEHHGSAPPHRGLSTSTNGGGGAPAAATARVSCDSQQPWWPVDAAGRKSADDSSATASRTTTVTGGADRALSLVDFCVLVSRLRPALIQRIRSPGVWEGTTCLGASGAPRDCQSSPVNHRLDARRVVGTSGEESVDGASIADVTVSPMTPTTVTSAAPLCTASSPSPSPRSSAKHHLRKRHPLVRHRFADPRRPLRVTASASLPAAPPTARQLSRDHQFSVEHAQREPHSSLGEGRGDGSQGASAGYAQPTAASQQRRRGLRVPSMVTAPLCRTKVPVWNDGLRASACRRHTSRTRSPPSTSSGSSRGSVSPDKPHHQHQHQHHRSNVSLHNPTRDTFARATRAEWGASLAPRGDGGAPARSPATSVSPLSRNSMSPSSPESAYKRGPLPPKLTLRVLETLQSTALVLLRQCAQLDSRRTGRITPNAWLRVLQGACPMLTNAERLRVQEWIRARGHGSAGGDDYTAVVEDILTEAGVASPSPMPGVQRSADRQRCNAAATSPPHNYATETHGSPPGKGAVATRSSMPPSSPAKDASPAPRLSATKPRAAVRRQSSRRAPTPAPCAATARAQKADEDAKRLLANELMIACGGDTEALLEYFRAFEKDETGLLDEYVWRASLEELFRQTEGQEAPAWVVSGCVRLSRVPLDKMTATPSLQRGALPLASPALSAAHARVSRVPPAMRHTLCDYRYALEVLGVHVDG
ncbi:hypothetical protein LSCM1_05299 [Leishmania martiniquensis]|uniref:EF-hand domain-containing protein n=1 Tax=Leishmania martiniquensis TaxID=1580590 RepID=A0A836HHI9_9TRYP|nr:hypothetical protein LSCM1_05299 [Leishmania martiniquensis]